MEKEVCMKNQFFADTSSICYKWILLKNVSVMHRCFTCFPPPRCDWKRLMGLFYPLLVRVQHIIPSSLRKKRGKNWASPHLNRFPSLRFVCQWFQRRWIIKETHIWGAVFFFKLKITTMLLYLGVAFSKALYSWRILYSLFHCINKLCQDIDLVHISRH